MKTAPFAPSGPNVTVNLVAGNTPGVVQFDNILPNAQSPTGNPSQQPRRRSSAVRIFNAGPSVAFIELIGTNQANSVSVNTSFPVPVNSERVFNSQGADWLAAIVASGNATLYATPGEGGI